MSVVYAQPANFNIDQLTDQVNTATGTRDFSNIGQILDGFGGVGLVTIMFFVAGSLMLVYLIYGGIMLMTSAADPKKVAGAHETIKNAFVGILVVIFSYWIVEIVGLVLGLPAFQQVFR